VGLAAAPVSDSATEQLIAATLPPWKRTFACVTVDSPSARTAPSSAQENDHAFTYRNRVSYRWRKTYRMTTEQYQEYLRNSGQQTPVHLKQRPLMVALRLELEEREASRKNPLLERIDRALDNAYRKWGPDSHNLRDFIYRALHYRRFKVWPVTGKKTAHVATGEALRRLHDAVVRICYRPEDIGGDPRTKTIYNYTGIDDKGRPERFSAFLQKLLNNRYKGMRRKELEAENEWVRFEDDPIKRGEFGGISTDLAALQGQGVLPEVGAVITNHVPSELALQLSRLRSLYVQRYPEIAEHHLSGVVSASKIERLIKGTPSTNKRKAPKGRKAIRDVMDSHVGQHLGLAYKYVREQQRLAIERGLLDPETALDLSIPDVMEREGRRVLGWLPKPPKVKLDRASEQAEVVA
jgi:hypothetical protein